MSSSALTNSAGAPATVTRALDAFANGQLDLAEVQQIMMAALQQGQGRSEAIHELLDEALTAQHLSISDYGELSSALGSVASENVPTEASADAPDASGVYRVLDAGAMVRDERHRAADHNSVAVAAGNGVADEAEFTRPLAPADGAQSPQRKLIGAGHILRERFRLEAEVARGSMGVVYRATDLIKQNAEAADPRLAIKLVSPSIANNTLALRAFQGEVASTQHLAHPHIVQLYDLDRDGDTFFITMEWLEGESLAAVLDRSRNVPLADAEVRRITGQLCAALSYAHEHGVVHADVKPGNVFVTAGGEIKLIDFGVARSVGSLETERSAGMTPVYASCERLEQAPPTPRDDLYSLACVIYRMLTGRRVFGSLTALEAEERGLEPQPVGAISSAAWQALRRALAFRAADRQADVEVFAREFLGGATAERVDPHTLSMPPELADVFDDAVAAQSGPLPAAAGTGEPTEAAAAVPPLDIEWELPEDDVEPAPQPELLVPPVPDSGETSPTMAPSAGRVRPDGLAAGTEEPPVGVLRRYRWVVVGACVLLLVGALAVLNPRPPAPVLEVTEPAPADSGAAADSAPAGAPSAVDDAAVAAAPPAEGPPAPVAITAPDPAPEPPAEAVATAAPVQQPQAAAETAPVAPAEAQVAAAVNTAIAPQPEILSEPTELELLLSLDTAVRLSLADGRLEGPLRDNAVYYVDKMRAIDPADPVTTSAVAELAAAFVAQAQASVDAGEAERALYELDLADQFDGPDELTEPLRRQAEALAAEYAARASAAAAAEAEAEAAAAAAAAAAAPVFDPNEPVALGDLEFADFVEPRYPRRLDRDYTGWVDLEFRVDAEGRTTEVVVVDMNLPEAFAQPSLDAVREWRFKPYEFAGEPVAVRSAVRLRFEN
ncbi:MAG: protein kinase [Gammaproteobacteria bacterium]|jgi:serine/threonine protein kinase|nr:protein kinase [Gammaproteobacteria bacterium]